jgi:NTE family protein
MGGLIASALAIGMSIDEIERIALRFQSKREIIRLIDRTPSRKGLLAGKNVRKFLTEFIPSNLCIEETRIPLIMNAVDLNSGKEIPLNEGNLIDAIMATTAIPGFFPPVEIGPYRLVDGGALNDVPVNFLKESSVDLILAVDVHQRNNHLQSSSPLSQPEPLPIPILPMMQDFYRVETIVTGKLVEFNLERFPPDMLISPKIPAEVTTLVGFQHVSEVISAGEVAMRDSIPQLLNLLSVHD